MGVRRKNPMTLSKFRFFSLFLRNPSYMVLFSFSGRVYTGDLHVACCFTERTSMPPSSLGLNGAPTRDGHRTPPLQAGRAHVALALGLRPEGRPFLLGDLLSRGPLHVRLLPRSMY